MLALFVAGAFAFITLLPARRAAASWQARRVGEAVEDASSWSRLRVWPNQYHQVLAAAYLSIGNREAAGPHLDAIRGKRLLVNLISKEELGRRLFARSRYDDFLAYDLASRPMFGDDEAALYRAAAFVSTNRIAEADVAMKAIDRDEVDATKLGALDKALAARRQGIYPYIIDSTGRAIAIYEMANRDVVAINTDFAPLVEKEAGGRTIESQLAQLGANETIETTLDPATQRAALTALSGFRGALVVIDPRNNTILAAASARGNGPQSNLALEQQYEPGSIIKVLTAMNAAKTGIGVQFPYQCNGELIIDDRRFGDWLPAGHGALPDIEEAMAQSCNIVFADLGIRLGVDQLRQFMGMAGFDSDTDIGLYSVPLGRTIGPMLNKYETALYSIGLEHETTTVLHLAMIASMVANRGVLTPPTLLRGRRSVLGESTALPRQGVTIVPREAADVVVRTMVAAATREKATGRRVSVEGLTVALKTGTAGSASGGLNSVIIGFAPVVQPKIAFALVAEDAGPAEYAGAKIAHDFLASVQPLR